MPQSPSNMKASGQASVSVNGRSIRIRNSQKGRESEDLIGELENSMELDRADHLIIRDTRGVNASAQSRPHDNIDTILQMAGKERKPEGSARAGRSNPSRVRGTSAHGERDRAEHAGKVAWVAKVGETARDVKNAELSISVPITPSSLTYRRALHPEPLLDGSVTPVFADDEDDEAISTAHLPSPFRVIPAKSASPKPSRSRDYEPIVEITMMPLHRIQKYTHPSCSQSPTLESRRALSNKTASVFPLSSRESSQIRRPAGRATRMIPTWRADSTPLYEEDSNEFGGYGTRDEEEDYEEDEMEQEQEQAESDIAMLRGSSERQEAEPIRSTKVAKQHSVRYDRPSFLCVGIKGAGFVL